MTNTTLSPAELNEVLGGCAANWPGLGLTVVRGTPTSPDAADEVTIRQGDVVIGFTHPSPEFRGKRVYRVVITDAHPGVPLPAGFLPPDPVLAQRNERLRWLPAGHTDRPLQGQVRRTTYTEA